MRRQDPAEGSDPSAARPFQVRMGLKPADKPAALSSQLVRQLAAEGRVRWAEGMGLTLTPAVMARVRREMPTSCVTATASWRCRGGSDTVTLSFLSEDVRRRQAAQRERQEAARRAAAEAARRASAPAAAASQRVGDGTAAVAPPTEQGGVYARFERARAPPGRLGGAASGTAPPAHHHTLPMGLDAAELAERYPTEAAEASRPLRVDGVLDALDEFVMGAPRALGERSLAALDRALQSDACASLCALSAHFVAWNLFGPLLGPRARHEAEQTADAAAFGLLKLRAAVDSRLRRRREYARALHPLLLDAVTHAVRHALRRHCPAWFDAAELRAWADARVAAMVDHMYDDLARVLPGSTAAQPLRSIRTVYRARSHAAGGVFGRGGGSAAARAAPPPPPPFAMPFPFHRPPGEASQARRNDMFRVLLERIGGGGGGRKIVQRRG